VPIPRRNRITAYATTRHYGGPEEGGWWYDVEEALKDWTKPISPNRTREMLNEWVTEMERAAEHLNEGDIGSVSGGTKITIRLEETFGQFQKNVNKTPCYC